MVKRNVKMMLVLSIAVSLSAGGTAVKASTLSNVAPSSQTQTVEKKHNNVLFSILEGKLGYTRLEIENASKSGKTAFDLAKQKGVTEDQLRTMIIDAKSQRIDQKVSEGKITKEKAKTIKEDLKTNIKKWDGKLEHKNRNNYYSRFANKVLKDKLGFTEEQIKEAANSKKTAFELAGTKGIKADQFKTMIIDFQSQRIDQMVAEGKIPKDKADTIKTNIKTDIQKWDGKLNF